VEPALGGGRDADGRSGLVGGAVRSLLARSCLAVVAPAASLRWSPRRGGASGPAGRARRVSLGGRGITWAGANRESPSAPGPWPPLPSPVTRGRAVVIPSPLPARARRRRRPRGALRVRRGAGRGGAAPHAR